MFRTVQGMAVQGVDVQSDGAKAGEVRKQSAYFWLVCDNRSCGVNARADIPSREELPAEADTKNLGIQWMRQFTDKAQEEGWMIGLDAQFCPYHAQQLIDQERRREAALKAQEPAPLVQVASPAEVSRAMRNLKAGKVGSN